MGDVIAVAVAAAFFVALLAGAEAATRRWKLPPERSRKLVHVSSGVAAAGLPLVMSFPAVAVLAFLFIPFMAVSRRAGLFPSIHAVERSTLGEVYFPLGVLVVAVLFPHRAAYAYGVLVMGVSDAAASVAGQRWGRRRYRLSATEKTYVGSAAFLATTVALGVAVTGTAGVAVAVLVAPALTLVEAASGGGVDNVLLPVTAAALLSVAT